MPQQIETLKSQNAYHEAGALAFRSGLPCDYGCHYGMRSTRAAAIAEFERGYNDAKGHRTMIRVSYVSCDGYRQTRKFKTLRGARRFAHEWIGAHPDVGQRYAVSFDGIGRVTVEGATLADLFPTA